MPSNPSSQGRILVVRGGAIGDFILTLPVLAALRRHFPQARLEVLGYPHIASLARLGGLADDVHFIEARAMAGFFAAHGPLAPELMEYFSRFDLIVSYLFDPDEVFQANVKRCGEARFIVGPHRPNESLRIHAAECLLQPLERLAIFSPDPVPRLKVELDSSARPSAEDSSSLDGNQDRRTTLALHPGSGSEEKNWPEQQWAALLQRLAQETHWRFLLVGGEAEEERVSRLHSLLPADRTAVALSTPLSQLAQRLAACTSFIGHDSGISHLASAVGLPGIVLWGDTLEEIWRPRGEGIRILRHPEGLRGMTVDEVWEAVQAGKTR